MEMRNPNLQAVNLLKALQAFISEHDSTATTPDIIRDLQRDGVDFSKTLKDISKHVERAENRLRLQNVSSRAKKMTFQPVDRLMVSIQELREYVATHIASLGSSRAVEAFYKKLETAEEEDLRSLLEDFEELEALAKDESANEDK